MGQNWQWGGEISRIRLLSRLCRAPVLDVVPVEVGIVESKQEHDQNIMESLRFLLDS